jgi:hypothetical protein
MAERWPFCREGLAGATLRWPPGLTSTVVPIVGQWPPRERGRAQRPDLALFRGCDDPERVRGTVVCGVQGRDNRRRVPGARGRASAGGLGRAASDAL